jgi:DNA-directed RNA polymerase subunit RPC12/RpoP
MEWTTEIVNGDCPECEEKVLLINLYENFYRCINCGYDVEQKLMV